MRVGEYRVELYVSPTRGKPFVFMKSGPFDPRFSLSAYVWPVVIDIRGPLRRNLGERDFPQPTDP